MRFTNILLSMILSRDGSWTASRPVIYGTYAATVAAHGLIAAFFGRTMPTKRTSMMAYLSVALVFATVVSFLAGRWKMHSCLTVSMSGPADYRGL